jgi:DNA-binding MarR family transcriptional regulator
MSGPRWLEENQHSTWVNFLAAATILNRRVEQQLVTDSGLSARQYEVLVMLYSAPGGSLRMTDLIGVGRTTKSGLTYQVGQLEKVGLVRREACATDERGVVATLTDAGWDALRAAAPGHLDLVRELFIDPLTDEQFTALGSALTALVDRLQNQPDGE